MRRNPKNFLDDSTRIFWDFMSFDLEFSYNPLKVYRAPVDIAANKLTQAEVLVNQFFSSQIDKVNDIDWIKVNLVAGHAYEIHLDGLDTAQGTLADPIIKGIYNSQGKSLGSQYVDNDSGDGRNALLHFTPQTSGVYFISVSGAGRSTGTYSLSVSEDMVSPEIMTITPNNQNASVTPSDNIVINFSEKIILGVGDVRLIGADGDERIINVGDLSQIQVSDNVLTINPLIDLHSGVSYSLSIDPGAVSDLSGNIFNGLNNSQYSFTTINQVEVPHGPLPSWTIMVYMAADNNLEPFALADLNELESIANISSLNITALVDRTPGYSSSAGNWTDTRVGLITYDQTASILGLDSKSSWGELNTGAAATLTNFINWSVEMYPANNYALVVWDHGGGIDGIAWDDTSGGDHLTINELTNAISNAVSFSNADNLEKFDLIAMDACLMGMAEIAYPLSSYTDFFISSEELVPGNGFPYDDWLSVLSELPNASPNQLVDSLLSSYATEYAGAPDITLSSISMAGMNDLIASLNQFCQLAVSSSVNDLKQISKLVGYARDYPSDQSYDYADLGHAMSLIGASSSLTNIELKNAALAVGVSLNELITNEVGSVSQATGLSIYLPYGREVVAASYVEANFSFLNAVPLWDDFLRLI